jgi:hypothetical protein
LSEFEEVKVHPDPLVFSRNNAPSCALCIRTAVSGRILLDEVLGELDQIIRCPDEKCKKNLAGSVSANEHQFFSREEGWRCSTRSREEEQGQNLIGISGSA